MDMTICGDSRSPFTWRRFVCSWFMENLVLRVTRVGSSRLVGVQFFMAVTKPPEIEAYQETV